MSPSTVDISGRGITLITNRLSNTTTTGWWLTNPPEKYEFVRLDHQFGKKIYYGKTCSKYMEKCPKWDDYSQLSGAKMFQTTNQTKLNWT
jgi:hypothetical protein